MKNSKIVQILGNLNQKENGRLIDYLSSPLFNKNNTLIDLANALLSFKEDYSNPKLTSSFLMNTVYDNKNRKIEKLRNDLSILLKHIKNFLSIEEYMGFNEDRNVKLLKVFREKDLQSFFDSEASRIKENIDSIQSEQDYYTTYLFYDELDKFFLNKRTRKYDSNLQSKMDAFDNFYLSIKLREVCEMLNRNEIYDKKYDIRLEGLLEIVLPNVELSQYDSYVRLYYAAYKMLKTKNKQEFKLFLNLLDTNIEAVPKDEIRELYIHAQNFCTRKINQGEQEYFTEQFRIFKGLIEHDLILSNGEIPHTTYKNIVTTALNINENEWANQFMEDYSKNLNENIRVSAYSYSLANYKYEIGQIEEAVKLLQSVNYEDNYYQIDARYLLLKIFYETGEHESLLYYIDAFKLYLKRNKDFNIQTREHIITFLKLLRKTTILRNRKNYLSKEEYGIRLKKLNEQFRDNQSIPSRKWMANMIQDLNIK